MPTYEIDNTAIQNSSHNKLKLITTIFIISSLTFVFSIFIWQINRDYDMHIRNAEQYASNLVLSASQHAEDTIKDIEAFSDSMVERIEWDGLDNLDNARLKRTFLSQVRIIPQINGIFIIDHEGNWLLTDKDQSTKKSNNSDREYFIYHKNHRDKIFKIGSVIKSRSTGELVIPLSRRLENPDGSFAGVFLTTLEINYLNDFYSKFKLGSDDIFSIALSDGTILTRRPFDESKIGTNIAKGDIFSKYLPHSATGTARLKSIVDGIERINSYRQLDRYPIVVQAGLTVEGILSQWRNDLVRFSVIIFSMTFILAIIGFLLFLQIRHTSKIEAKLKLALDSINKIAGEDALTGLKNRRSLDQALPQEIGRAHRANSPLGLIILDIDYFKKYNDCYGHVAGDDCIRSVSNCIKSSIHRQSDLASRYGGEEMLILLPNTNESGVHDIARKILERLSVLNIPHKESPIGRVTVSIGTYCYHPADEIITPDKLVSLCDEHLYLAKANGRNTVYPE